MPVASMHYACCHWVCTWALWRAARVQFKGICCSAKEKQEVQPVQAASVEAGVLSRLGKAGGGCGRLHCEHAAALRRPSRACACHLRAMRGGWRKRCPIQPAGAQP